MVKEQLILLILIALVLTGCAPSVLAVDSITPVPEPTRPGSIPPMTPMPPIAPRADRAYLPVVFGGNPCAAGVFYACGEAR